MPRPKVSKPPPPTKFYAVKTGKTPGVYATWAECQANTTGFKGAIYKSFLNRSEAEDYVAGRAVAGSRASGAPPKFYGVAVGKKPGVYTSWDEAQLQIVGVKGPRYRKFETRAEAEEFVRSRGSSAVQPGAKRARDDDDDDDDDEEGPTNPPNKKSRAAGKGPGDVLVIYTDGSSRGNGKKGACAGVGAFFGVNDPRNVSERLEGEPQTNQRAELTAILRAVEIPAETQSLHIVSDSNYSIKCVTAWYAAWEKNGWMTASKQPVLNRDLVEAIRARIAARERAGATVAFSWVKGHADDPGNVAADQLAVAGAAKPRKH